LPAAVNAAALPAALPASVKASLKLLKRRNPRKSVLQEPAALPASGSPAPASPAPASPAPASPASGSPAPVLQESAAVPAAENAKAKANRLATLSSFGVNVENDPQQPSFNVGRFSPTENPAVFSGASGPPAHPGLAPKHGTAERVKWERNLRAWDTNLDARALKMFGAAPQGSRVKWARNVAAFKERERAEHPQRGGTNRKRRAHTRSRRNRRNTKKNRKNHI
jgi:hypothetical protein